MAEYCEFDWNSRNPMRGHMRGVGDCGESQTSRAQALSILQKLLDDSLHGELKGIKGVSDEKDLMRFLYARKFNVTETLKLIENYSRYRKENAEVFETPATCKFAIKDGFPCVLKERDRKGRCVLIMFASNWDHNLYSLIDIYRALIASLEKLTKDSTNQSCGFVVIVDWNGLGMRQTSSLSPRLLKTMIEGLQDCYPAKFKAIHFVQQPWYVETALAVIKPFLKEKTRHRIHSHGNNLSTLHDFIARDVLPTELGGEGPPVDTSYWANQILQTIN